MDLSKSTDVLHPTAVTDLVSDRNLLIINDRNNFYSIIKEIDDRVLLVEFFARWCGPCKRLAPQLEELAYTYNGKILLIKVDVDKFEEIALEHDVSAIPTFMVIKNQKKLQQFFGSNVEHLKSILEKFVGKLKLNEPKYEESVNKKEDSKKKMKL